MTTEHSLIVGVVLAAGESRRMGFPKQLMQYGSTTLLQHIIQSVHDSCDLTTVVLGANADRISSVIPSTAEIVLNSNWKQGLHTSIRCVVQHVRQTQPEARAVLFATVDQPFVTADLLMKLIEGHRTKGFKIVASQYAGTVGIPALFDSDFFDELCALQESGAKNVICNHDDVLLKIPFQCGEIDLDTPEQYRMALQHPNKTEV